MSRGQAWRVFVSALALGGVLAVAGGWWAVRPDRGVQAVAGMAAQQICGAAFIQKLDTGPFTEALVRPQAGVYGPFLRAAVDRAAGTVQAQIGPIGARARWTEGYGCRVVIDANLPFPAPVKPRPPAPPDGFAPPDPVAPESPRLQAALAALFEDGQPGRRQVKAVVVVKDGRVVAERYAAGYGVDTPLLSFSVAKAVMHALVGALVLEGRLRLDDPVDAPEWRTPGDPRAAITIEDLLRMQSGLDAPRSALRLQYTQDDPAAAAARDRLASPPGQVWRYRSANSFLLARRLKQVVGGAPAMRAFAEEALFAPARMDGVTLAFDAAGSLSGSAYVYAPARAFARLGQLYLDDGVAADGRRILPAGWAGAAARSSLGAPYGAGFWTVDGNHSEARRLVAAGFPADGFYASGNLGQRIYIAPSQNLVVARFGYTRANRFGIDADMAFLRVALAELRSPAVR